MLIDSAQCFLRPPIWTVSGCAQLVSAAAPSAIPATGCLGGGDGLVTAAFFLFLTFFARLGMGLVLIAAATTTVGTNPWRI